MAEQSPRRSRKDLAVLVVAWVLLLLCVTALAVITLRTGNTVPWAILALTLGVRAWMSRGRWLKRRR